MLYRIRKPGRQLGEPLLSSGHRDTFHFRRGQKLQKDRLTFMNLAPCHWRHGSQFATRLQQKKCMFAMMEHTHKHSFEGLGSGVLIVALAVNIVFVAAEAIVGWWSNSTGLLSDAGHNLSDVLGLGLSLLALSLEHRGGKDFRKVSRYVTLVNGALLMVAVVIILFESIDKILNPVEVNGMAVIITSAAAIVVNGLTAFLLMKGEKDDINIRAAFLHAASDTLVSVAVVASGIVIRLTGWNLIDPILSLLVSVLIAVPTVRLIANTVRDIRNIG